MPSVKLTPAEKLRRADQAAAQAVAAVAAAQAAARAAYEFNLKAEADGQAVEAEANRRHLLLWYYLGSGNRQSGHIWCWRGRGEGS